MSVISEEFRLEFMPLATPEAVVLLPEARFTVLTERLIRIEYHPDGNFEDRASQAFWYRQQPVPQFNVKPLAQGIEIETPFLHLIYTGASGEGITSANLSIRVKATDTVWHPGDVDESNLRGTTRTLDFANGYEPLGSGLMSRAGWSVIDDSKTLVFNAANWLEPRTLGGLDLYFFGYGHDYKACLRDYCRVSGEIPMIPRWALGNWWSRYWAYTQDELVTLIEDFQAYELPLSVCIVDMDWHITETGNDCSGWTGYTWNRKLFPDPQGLIDFMHAKGLKVSLNLHPAEGIHSHEEQYEAMARCMDVDPTTKQPVLFDITNPTFARAYFEVLHRPYEAMGIDFWWVDWQQGLKSKLPGLDPLWLINHLHFYDLGRDGTKRPFIFSRWGSEGHQRYPIGFSGDSYVTWDTLAFESYMTPTASNIAYGWWSHDIGGHTSGVEDTELFTRWVQFGALSPINRLHVTKGLFYDRRPWMLGDAEALRVLRHAFQLRHALIPYLYTMAYRAHSESIPLMTPMYYDYPDEEAAYHCPQQYLFGTELIAAPYVSPADPDTGLSRQVVWLPEGGWYHFFTGEYFEGNRWQAVYGKLDDIPLFAREGAIVPLSAAAELGRVGNPDMLHVHVFAGADRTFTLYEDDGETTAYLRDDACKTTFTQRWSENALTFTMDAPEGNLLLIPARRVIDLTIHGVCENAKISVKVDGSEAALMSRYDTETETLYISGIEVERTSALEVTIEANSVSLLARRDRTRETLLRMLKAFKLNTGVRNIIGQQLDTVLADPAALAPYLVTMSQSQARALFETLYSAGIHVVHDTHHPTLIILWNNQQRDLITYRYGEAYLFFGMVRDTNHEYGNVPPFMALTPPVNRWSHGAQGEHVHRTQWHAQIDYANLLTVSESHREVSP